MQTAHLPSVCTWLSLINEGPQLVFTHSSNYSLDSSMHKLQCKRLVMFSVSLHTQIGLYNLTIQVLNTRVYFIDI